MDELDKVAQGAEQAFDLAEYAKTVRACRSYRRFDEGEPIPEALLVALVDLARTTASGANRQPLCYRIVNSSAECARVFPKLRWAAALKDWDGPVAGEHPTGYIVICDAGRGATTSVDEGIAAQTILLGATQAGFGGCMLHAFDKHGVADELGFDADAAKPLMVVALGRPVEDVRLEPASASPDGTLAYWRDAAGVHHVPKRSLENVLL